MMRQTKKALAAALLPAAFLAGMASFGTLLAAEEGPHIEEQEWSFSGPFGTYDQAQLQRGFQIYAENCAGCHSLKYVAFRNLMEPGGPSFSEEEAKAIAMRYVIEDGPDESGSMFERPARLSDTFPTPFANEEEARSANNGAYPPDFSLLAKARAAERGFPQFLFDVFTQYQEGGPDYIYALLTGYEEPPSGVEVASGLYYNPHFISGDRLAMPQPLYEDGHTYTDGSPQTVEQYARDVSAFMMWAAEPKLMERKRMGFGVMIFLIVFAGLLYFTKRKVWAAVDH